MGCIATLHPDLVLKRSPKHEFKATDRDRTSQIVSCVPFFYLLSMKSLFCLHSTRRSWANQKCRDLHRPWSASPLFGLKLSCNRWSYFKATAAAACPVLPISLSGNTESLIYCLAALLHPRCPLLSVRTHKASLPCSFHLQMAYQLYCEEAKYQRERKSVENALSDTISLTSQQPLERRFRSVFGTHGLWSVVHKL